MGVRRVGRLEGRQRMPCKWVEPGVDLVVYAVVAGADTRGCSRSQFQRPSSFL